MAAMHSGGCHCGGVRYSVSADPEMTFFCHCSDCQKTTGSPFSIELMLPSSGFTCEGELATYTVTGDSGQAVHRRYCPKCGSGLFLECDADPGYIFLKAGTLDDAAWVKPEAHIYTGKMQPWVKIADGLPAFEGAPPLG